MTRRLCFGIGCVLFVVCVSTWCVWFRFFSAEQFAEAMRQAAYSKAERIWKWGVYAPKANAYVEMMELVDELRGLDGVTVVDYDVREALPLNGAKRYRGLVHIRESTVSNSLEFTVALEWRKARWVLRSSIDLVPTSLPAYSGSLAFQTLKAKCGGEEKAWPVPEENLSQERQGV